jgi:hypothetical protein
VRGNEESPFVGGPLEDPAARGHRLVRDENRPVTIGGEPEHGGTGGVAGRELQGEVFVDAVPPVPQHGLSGPMDGRDAVFLDEAVDHLPAGVVGASARAPQ